MSLRNPSFISAFIVSFHFVGSAQSYTKFDHAVFNKSCDILKDKKDRSQCEVLVAQKIEAEKVAEIAYRNKINEINERQEKKRIDQLRSDSIAKVEVIKKQIMDSIAQARIVFTNDSIAIAKKDLKLSEDKQKKEQYKDSIYKKYGVQNGSLILDGKVQLGFTKDMCLEAWGKPDEVHTTVMKGMIAEYWIYLMEYKASGLWFTNGKLETIQN